MSINCNKTRVGSETEAVIIDASDEEFLLYRVIVRGPTPIFTLVDAKNNALLMSSKDEPVPGTTDTYERRWPKPSDGVSVHTSHTIGFQFLGVEQYTYQVEHHRKNAPAKALIDIDYRPTSPEDSCFESLDIVTF